MEKLIDSFTIGIGTLCIASLTLWAIDTKDRALDGLMKKDSITKRIILWTSTVGCIAGAGYLTKQLVWLSKLKLVLDISGALYHPGTL